MAAAGILALLAAVVQLHLAEASATLFLRLDHYENLQGILKNHARCDSGSSQCDPLFEFTVRGSWGTWRDSSDCIMNSHQLDNPRKIGSRLANPIELAESTVSTVVNLDIRVKECLLNEVTDDIGDFYAELTEPLKPFFFTERVNLEDTLRIRTIELTPVRDTPLSVKLRVTLWRQCSQFYYGPDCSKFCRSIAGHACDPGTGQLTCSGPSCPPIDSRTTRPATAAPGERVTAAPPAAAATHPGGPSVRPTPRVPIEVSPLKATGVNWSIFAALFAFLAVLALVAIGILLALKRYQQPKRRHRGPNQSLIPPPHSVVVGLRDGSPAATAVPGHSADSSSDRTLQTEAIPNLAYACYSLRQRQPLILKPPQPVLAAELPDPDAYEEEDGAGFREASGIYEDPEDPAMRELPEPPPPPPPRLEPPLMSQPRPSTPTQPPDQQDSDTGPSYPPPLPPTFLSQPAPANNRPPSPLPPQPLNMPMRTQLSKSFSKAPGARK